jgi:superfamily II DNA or RNA helicase
VRFEDLKPQAIVTGPIFAEPVQVLMIQCLGNSVKLYGKGMRTGMFHEPILNAGQVALLEATPEREPFDGDAGHFCLAVEAMRLGLAYEYDPYFSLSIARVDPLPHQLEAVYEYFLRLPRIRFLLADDPGAGKTIMAGLLLKELKVRGLVKRTLIVTPANLTFQWKREMVDKFREDFKVVRGTDLRDTYGKNPWQEVDQAITSISWVSRIDDARDSLLRSRWDLIIVDEAHKMSAYSADKKTLAYQLGEHLSEMTDHFLLMTATPHKGDPDNFALFLRLLDPDVYGDVKSLEEAIKQHSAPFYLRRVKEALVTFPDPNTGQAQRIFTKRNVRTAAFEIDIEEMAFYEALTRYVEDQSSLAAADHSARGRALGFTMAMLQRRFASSVFAVRRSLERMRDRRQKILDDPDGYRQAQIERRLPDDFDELEEDEQQKIMEDLEGIVASVNPTDLREEIVQLGLLIKNALWLEDRQVESKLRQLRDEISRNGVFDDPKMKLLIFTEHKDTLDYLVLRLREWGLTVTQIHGSMKVGSRDEPGTRINAEREFREDCQVLVATEAAGEGINLQFCWFMINYDIPWNPVRLEQRMGRIHRYGQQKDCLILNFVATNTVEGRVLGKLFERVRAIEEDLDPNLTGQVFNVLGDVFPANRLEQMLRDMYAHNQMTEELIISRIVEQVDPERFRQITHSTLEGLAKRTLNLSAIVGKSAEARERRLVPEVVENFFTEAARTAGFQLREAAAKAHVYRVGRVPRSLQTIGEELEPSFGKLGRDYRDIVFDKTLLGDNATLEWVTPGHPLFEAVRKYTVDQFEDDLRHGAVFFDLHREHPSLVDVYSAAIRDGRGHTLHRRLFLVQTAHDGTMTVSQPTLFFDVSPAPTDTPVPMDIPLPDQAVLQRALLEKALIPFADEVSATRGREVETIARHLEISLKAIIDKEQVKYATLHEAKLMGSIEQGLDGRLKMQEDRLDELNHRLERRRAELEQERHCTIAEVQHHGRAWILPHPERENPQMRAMVQDAEIERIAVQAVIAHEEAQGYVVQSVEAENKGFDLISRKPHPEDPQTAIDVRFIEVKGRAGIGNIALTENEYRTAERLKKDYWLYVVYNCSSDPAVHVVRDPARLGWEPVVTVAHYQVGAGVITGATDQPA